MTFLLDNTSPPSAATQITLGSTWNSQAWFRDPAAGGACFDLSDGLSVIFMPLRTFEQAIRDPVLPDLPLPLRASHETAKSLAPARGKIRHGGEH